MLDELNYVLTGGFSSETQVASLACPRQAGVRAELERLAGLESSCPFVSRDRGPTRRVLPNVSWLSSVHLVILQVEGTSCLFLATVPTCVQCLLPDSIDDELTMDSTQSQIRLLSPVGTLRQYDAF